MIFDLNLSPAPFYLIKNEKKVIEMRLATPIRKEINVGDNIRFTRKDTGETLLVEVIDKKEFKDFEELYKAYPKNELGYSIKETPDYKDMYQYYSKSEIDKYGVIAFKIKLLN